MRRLDTTSEAYQRAWRGTHNIPSYGVWSYPPGNGRRGTRYLRCLCGWRLVEIYDTTTQYDQATTLHYRHKIEMRKNQDELC
jgi:hypothetical protein